MHGTMEILWRRKALGEVLKWYLQLIKLQTMKIYVNKHSKKFSLQSCIESTDCVRITLQLRHAHARGTHAMRTLASDTSEASDARVHDTRVHTGNLAAKATYATYAK